jgi:hypothetical protein
MAQLLQAYETYYIGQTTFQLHDLHKLHRDADSQFVSEAFTGRRIMVEIAAPKHQEMNGIVEAAWRAICLLAARALIIHGRVSQAFPRFRL